MLITLIGFMASGKSTLGACLALCLGRPFRDLDREVERRTGRDLGGIFLQDGEPEFRRLEREALLALDGFAGVLAVGGGLPCQPGMADWLNARGPVLFLDPPLEVLLERLRTGSPRPLAQGRSDPELARLHAQRMPCYQAAGRRVPLPAGLAIEAQLDLLLAALRAPVEPERQP